MATYHRRFSRPPTVLTFRERMGNDVNDVANEGSNESHG